MTVQNALKKIFTLAIPTDSAHAISDIRNILIGPRSNTVYKAAFSRDLGKIITAPAFDLLANELLAYMSGSAKSLASFDEWHHSVCDNFKNELNKHTPRMKKYGKAQKALNIAAKYLYCCNDANNALDQAKFTYFHIALDGYTYIDNNYPLSFYRDVVIPWKYRSMPRGTVKYWSRLEYENYRTAVENIREFFDAHPHTFNDYLSACHAEGVLTNISPVPVGEDRILTPFEAEFFIWEICKENKSAVFKTLF
jgi:hypothetical protein